MPDRPPRIPTAPSRRNSKESSTSERQHRQKRPASCQENPQTCGLRRQVRRAHSLDGSQKSGKNQRDGNDEGGTGDGTKSGLLGGDAGYIELYGGLTVRGFGDVPLIGFVLKEGPASDPVARNGFSTPGLLQVLG